MFQTVKLDMVSFWKKYSWQIIRGLLFLLFSMGSVDQFNRDYVKYQLMIEKYPQHDLSDFNPFNYASFNINFFPLILLIIYPPTIKYLEKSDMINKISLWKTKEVAVFSVLIGLYLIISLLESRYDDTPLSVFYGI